MGVFDGKVAVITGSGRGLGRAEALLFASEGAQVVVNDLGGGTDGSGGNKSPADEVVAEITKAGGKAVANYDSVATWDGADKIIRTALDSFGRIDILINNAGILRDRMVFNMTEDEWDIVQKVHLYGHFYCTRHACEYFRKQRSGRIINTSSQSGLGNLGQANYSAAKEGIVGLTRTVAMDMAKYGVTVNCIRPLASTRLLFSPGLIEGFKRKAEVAADGSLGLNFGVQLNEMSNDQISAALDTIRPDYVAPLVAYLATDAAGNINGRTFYISGGEIGLYSEPEIVSSIFKDGAWTVGELTHLIPRSLAKGLTHS
jgi:NAD(P)-dependent dehydrogenase (short-subunit alcohol dehydrogenase family)